MPHLPSLFEWCQPINRPIKELTLPGELGESYSRKLFANQFSKARLFQIWYFFCTLLLLHKFPEFFPLLKHDNMEFFPLWVKITILMEAVRDVGRNDIKHKPPERKPKARLLCV
jgi:hypothetical protein